MQDGIHDRVKGKKSNDIYCVYTYTNGNPDNAAMMYVDPAVESIQNQDQGITGMIIPPSDFKVYLSKGDITKGSVGDTWNQIMSYDINKPNIVDFEVYGDKARDMTNVEVEIFIAVN